MKISDFLSPADVTVDWRADSKKQLLRDLSKRIATAAGLDGDMAATAIVKREELGSTGIGGGVAIPHARLKTLTRPFAVVAKLKHPIAFDAIDGRDVDLVALLLLPDAPDSDPLAALAAVTRRLKSPGVLPRLRAAKTAEAAYEALTD
jgi:PTS system nitrogen regulatory IIA component